MWCHQGEIYIFNWKYGISLTTSALVLSLEILVSLVLEIGPRRWFWGCCSWPHRPRSKWVLLLLSEFSQQAAAGRSLARRRGSRASWCRTWTPRGRRTGSRTRAPPPRRPSRWRRRFGFWSSFACTFVKYFTVGQIRVWLMGPLLTRSMSYMGHLVRQVEILA